jgi:Mg2+ and Co2+ transporter CorA
MKTFLPSLILFFVLSLTGFAQKAITVTEGPITFRHGNTPGITVSIPEVSFKKIQDSWIKTLEKGTKSKVMNEDNEISIFGAILKGISPAPVNIYSFVRDNDSAILLAATVELKKDVYVSMENNAEEFAKVKAFLLEFAKGHYLEVAQGQLDTEEKKLSKLESDLKSLENDKVKLEKMIQSNTNTIASTKDELNVLRTNLKSLNDELLAQTNAFNALEDGSAKDEKKKYIDDLEKRIKKDNKDVESGEKKIINLQSEIDKGQKETLPDVLKNQEQTRIAVEQQKGVVSSYQAKCENIKNSM